MQKRHSGHFLCRIEKIGEEIKSVYNEGKCCGGKRREFMSTKIFVMTHTRYEEPEDPTYETLQVGRATGDQSLPYHGDDDGENISAQNCYYGELTGYYWIWKNDSGKGNVGICHYRRFYVNDDGTLMTSVEFDHILETYDVITSDATVSSQTNEEGYGESHNIEDLYACGRAIEALCPEYSAAFQEVLASHHCYYANLLVTSREKFQAYCAWLFGIFDYAAKEIDVSGYDNYHKRVYGFLSEVLLGVWIRKNGYRVYEARIGLTGEKAETKALKAQLDALVQKKQFSRARQVYYDTMEVRPDVRLAQSDLDNALGQIECVLYILEQEALVGMEDFYAAGKNMTEWICHYRTILRILTALGCGTAKEAQVNYLLENKVSQIAVEVILRNEPAVLPAADRIRKILGMAE